LACSIKVTAVDSTCETKTAAGGAPMISIAAMSNAVDTVISSG
jgi:hypothetical protein